jgi:hypothetical protein
MFVGLRTNYSLDEVPIFCCLQALFRKAIIPFIGLLVEVTFSNT